MRADSVLPGMAVAFDGWKYIPIFEDGDVRSFVVLAVDHEPLSENISALWFINSGGAWTGYSWRDADQKAALTDVKCTLGLAQESDADWPVDPAIRPDGTSSSTTMDPIAIGVFPDDPFAPILEAQADPTELLSVLVSAGWKAADANLFKSECRRDQLLDGGITATKAPCSRPNIDWDPWGPWAPPGPGQAGSLCP